ncbi:MAG: glutaredoxin family protein [Deltaproteobacteria bacterium]|nr:glutaredoxin family protein [Deltaproteobacteria bacterium]
MLTLTIYSRPACHLCDEMKAVVLPLAAEFGAVVEEIDIDTDPALAAQYGLEIPVLLLNGRKAFKYRVTAGELRARLRRACSGIIASR